MLEVLDGREDDMNTIRLTVANAHLSKLVDRVATGETIDVTRRGKVVARLTAATTPRRRIDRTMLRAVTAAMPPQTQDAADLVQSLRDGDRY
jgi:prevent-host-death family protein